MGSKSSTYVDDENNHASSSTHEPQLTNRSEANKRLNTHHFTTDWLSGFRVAAMAVVVYGHCAYFPLMATDFVNDNYVRDFMKSYHSILAYPAILGVDVFFFLSGFIGFHLLIINFEKHEIVTYRERSSRGSPPARKSVTSKNKLEGDPLLVAANGVNGSVSINDDDQQQSDNSNVTMVINYKRFVVDTLLAYLHRYLRLTPLMAVCYGIARYAAPSMLHGPFSAVYESMLMWRLRDAIFASCSVLLWSSHRNLHPPKILLGCCRIVARPMDHLRCVSSSHCRHNQLHLVLQLSHLFLSLS